MMECAQLVIRTHLVMLAKYMASLSLHRKSSRKNRKIKQRSIKGRQKGPKKTKQNALFVIKKLGFWAPNASVATFFATFIECLKIMHAHTTMKLKEKIILRRK